MNETANEIKRLQGCINDLIGVLALPALWKGQDAKQIVKTLLDVLVATLRLDFAYALVNDPFGGGPIEMVRHDQLRHFAAEPGLVGQTLTQSLGANPRKWPPHARNPFGNGSLAVVPLGSVRNDEIGVIVAGSERADFPWQTETVVLSVAANQAAIGLASARAYEQERLRERLRSDAELEREKLRASEQRLIETGRLYRELQNREGKIRRLVDANIIGIFIWELEGRILDANDAFLTMLGYDREDLVSPGLRWTDLTPPEWHERDERLVPELKMAGALRPFEKEYFRKDGSRVPVLIGVATFEETVNSGVAFVLDLTERKRAEEALRELESKFAHMNRVSMMGELAASLAHEVTQPIGSARNNARTAQNFLKMQPPEPNEVHAALDRLIGNVDRAAEIIDRIRDNIKKAPPRNERFDLNAAINEVIALAQNVIVRNGVSVQIGLADEPLLVQGDRVQLQQVVLNLILNAVEAMGPAHAGERNLLVSTEREDSGVRVAVRDSGPGIGRRQLERVFESFYTTKPGGTGMGLSVCRSIVDAHGGRLWAEENEPRGAVFQFTWPGPEVGL